MNIAVDPDLHDDENTNLMLNMIDLHKWLSRYRCEPYMLLDVPGTNHT